MHEITIKKEYEKFENDHHDFKSINQNFHEHRDFSCIEFWLYDKKESIKSFFKAILCCINFKDQKIHADDDS